MISGHFGHVKIGIFSEIGIAQVRWAPEAGVKAHEYIDDLT